MHSGLTNTAKKAMLEGILPLISGKWELEFEIKSYRHIHPWGWYEQKRLVDIERRRVDLPSPVIEDGLIRWPYGLEDYEIEGKKYDERRLFVTIICNDTPIGFIDYADDFDFITSDLTLNFGEFCIGLF